MSGHLSTAAHHCGGKLHKHPQQSASNGLTGLLELPGLSDSLDLSHPSARLFGIELAGLQGSLQQEMQKLKETSEESSRVRSQNNCLTSIEAWFLMLLRRPIQRSFASGVSGV